MSVGHTASQQFKGCQRLLSPHNGLSGGSNRRFLFSGSHYLISQTSCVQRGARLGRITQNKGRYLGGGGGNKKVARNISRARCLIRKLDFNFSSALKTSRHRYKRDGR